MIVVFLDLLILELIAKMKRWSLLNIIKIGKLK